jgi:hypothetical protein
VILKNLEKKMWDVEGFQVRLVHKKSGRDVRGDLRDVGNYNAQRKAKGSLTVNDFIEGRLKRRFDKFGWKGQVVCGDGSTAHGGKLLKNVRDSYKK